MEKIGTKTIEINSWTKLEFDVYPCNCNIGDTVWFDDGYPNEDGVIFNHCYMKGTVTRIEPDRWWVYEEGDKGLGYVIVEVTDDGGEGHHNGQKFGVAFKDLIYDEPTEKPYVDFVQCEEEICKLAGVKNGMNKWGAPVWMDYQPGSYVNKEGKEVYSSKKKCEYVDKELVRELYCKYIETNDERYKKAFEYFLNN